jgi:hypothetical protein
MVVVNQTLFILRDNIIYVVDAFRRILENKFFSRGKVTNLFKIKNSIDDENGYKVLLFKVVAVNKNGTLQVFAPTDGDLMKDWQR